MIKRGIKMSEKRKRYTSRNFNTLGTEGKEYKKILGDKEIIKGEWERIEAIANRFIYAILTDF
ncbi:MAG: hypothetical protein U5N58_04905 [Actinomycetota bacterium]|nr:hypothetical protein [Actinomycetota bacterium]